MQKLIENETFYPLVCS